MSKRTNKFGLLYFEKDDFTSSLPEMQRWETLDAQLFALMEILGNGVISGWNIVASSGLNVVVTAGSGHVSFVALESTDNVTVGITGSAYSTTRNYIYAGLTSDSYWTKNVVFSSSVFENTNSNVLLLGYVDADKDSVIDINTDGKATLGFATLVSNAVKAHRHIGGTENPDPVNLATDVQGYLSQNNIPPLDANIFSSGTVDPDRLPLIDHISKMTNQGELTHSQLDSFVNSLSLPDQTTMGEVSTANLLQLILALKHIYPDIDEFLVNELAFIPGISPDDYIDTVNTTATVDTRTSSEGGTHTISGTPSTGTKAYTRIWNSEESFQSGTLSNTLIDGDSVSLSTKENTLIIDEFSDMSTWSIETQDLSSVPSTLVVDPTTYVVSPNSAKLTVGNENAEIILKIKKTFNAQDWSGYNYLRFYIKTESVEHGDLFFYFNDAVYGVQNSYKKVLNRNAPTIDIDTLENGWQEVTIDMSEYNRSNINEIGFYVSTQSGWDTSKGFSLNIDSITLTSGNIYQTDGYARFVFGSEFLYSFWRLRWDSIIPTDSESTGVVFKARTRVANTVDGLSTAVWTDYYLTSGYTIPIATGDLYKYIEIEFYFGASTSFKRSAVLKKAYLDFYVADVDNSFEYSTKSDWDSGYLYNIDTVSVSNSMSISNISEIGNVFYGTDGGIFQLDSNYDEIFSITGTMMPRSTYQILNDMPASFGLITAVSSGNNGNLWICDTDNDRVLELDRKGNAVRGFFGSYLVENVAGSNVAATTTTTTTTVSSLSNLYVISVLYNSDKGFLYVMFNRDITSDELLLLKGKYIKVGANRFYLDNFATSKPITGFDNVLKIQITGSDKTMLNYLVNPLVPSICILAPLQYKNTTSTVVAKFLVSGFTLGTMSGENGIRVTLDGVPQDIYSDTVTFSGLSAGVHTLKAQLLNANGSLKTNIEAIAEEDFIVVTITSQPYIYIKSPRANQIYSSSPVQIEFSVSNFPIVPNGPHIKYVVDGVSYYDHYSSDSIVIEGLSAGSHSVVLYLADESGNDLAYTYGTAEANFIVGNNSLATAKYCYDINGVLGSIDIDVCKLIFSDVYAPFDVQYIPFDESTVTVENKNGKESVLIGKLTNNYIVSKLG